MISARPLPRNPQPDKPRPRLPLKLQRNTAMTVCIAAICTWCGDDIEDCFRWASEPEPYIIGISDRMRSIQDFAQYESDQPKYIHIVNSVMALMAGDVAAQTEVFDRTCSYIWTDFNDDPRVIPVKEVAHRYEQDVCAFLNDRRDMIVRRRTGLKSFKDFQTNYHHEDREEIIEEIKKEPALETIITGIDESGPHIYLINHSGISCHDSTGFAVIGSGYFHTTSQLMRTRHSPKTPYVDTLLLLYMAKQHAEMDEYVGKDTDIFVITDNHTYDVLSEKTVKVLKDTYNEIYNRVLDEAKTKIQEHLIKERENAIAEAKRSL